MTPADTSKANESTPTSTSKNTAGDDEGKAVSAKEIIGLKRELKKVGKTDDELAKILPSVKTLGDYKKVIKEYGIAA